MMPTQPTASRLEKMRFKKLGVGRVIEYVDHLHEHFLEPCLIENAAYMPPKLPGFSIEMKPESIAEYQYR
jgi:L-fuconate dehydratase